MAIEVTAPEGSEGRRAARHGEELRLLVDGVGKRYEKRLAASRSARDAAEVAAITDVTFALRRGTVMGLVGRPGAGRSTLLRVVAGLSRQTEGSVRGWGTRASLLDLGRYIDYDLTARQNLVGRPWFRAAPGGRPVVPDMATLNAVAEAAGVSHVVRGRLDLKAKEDVLALLHAIVLHSAPDLLLADGRLVLGPAAYQEQARETIRKRVATGGSVLWAPPRLDDVLVSCDQALWLEAGRVHAIGPATEVVDEFRRATTAARSRRERDAPTARPSDVTMSLRALGREEVRRTFAVGDPVAIEVHVAAPAGSQLQLSADLYRDRLLLARLGAPVPLDVTSSMCHRRSVDVVSPLAVGTYLVVVRASVIPAGGAPGALVERLKFAVKSREGAPVGDDHDAATLSWVTPDDEQCLCPRLHEDAHA
jgi:ABC-type polysaccharide/polyol phosphate transport system ATPase subunit